MQDYSFQNAFRSGPFFFYPSKPYCLVEKGKPFTKEQIEFQNKFGFKWDTTHVEIKAILHKGKVKTFKEKLDEEEKEGIYMQRWKDGVQKARRLTIGLWLGLLP